MLAELEALAGLNGAGWARGRHQDPDGEGKAGWKAEPGHAASERGGTSAQPLRETPETPKTPKNGRGSAALLTGIELF